MPDTLNPDFSAQGLLRLERLEGNVDHLQRLLSEHAQQQDQFRTQVNDSISKLVSGQNQNQAAWDEKLNARIEKAINALTQATTQGLAETRSSFAQNLAETKSALLGDIAGLRTGVTTNAANLDNVRTTILTSGKVNWGLIIAGVGVLLTMVVTIVGAGAWAITALNEGALAPVRSNVASLQGDLKGTKEKADSAVNHQEHDVLRSVVDRKAEETDLANLRQEVSYLKTRDVTVAAENSKSTQDRADLQGRVGRLELGQADASAFGQRTERNFAEVETQFKDVTHVLNLERSWNGRVLAMLWERKPNQDFGRFPSENAYFPDLWKGESGASGSGNH
jgi:hypothetical protein